MIPLRTKTRHPLGMKIFYFFAILMISSGVFAQDSTKINKRVDLEDVKIKGEANKGNVSFSNRSRHSLNDRVKLRKDFNKEILENLPEEFNSQKKGQ